MPASSPAQIGSLASPSNDADRQSKQSFGSRVLRFITTGRQRKADAEIRTYVHTYRNLNGGTFIVDFCAAARTRLLA